MRAFPLSLGLEGTLASPSLNPPDQDASPTTTPSATNITNKVDHNANPNHMHAMWTDNASSTTVAGHSTAKVVDRCKPESTIYSAPKLAKLDILPLTHGCQVYP